MTTMDVHLDDGGSTSAVRYEPTRPADALLVLAHGAGAGQRHPFMVAVAQGLATRGIAVVTFDFVYMHQRRRAPDRTVVLEETFRRVIDAATRHSGPQNLFIGGKSMGGRMATHLAGQSLPGLRGVVVFGYPLHPPGKPEQLRTGHFPNVAAPLLVVQGEHDTFGTPEELQPHVAAIPAPVTLHTVPGGDHSLAVRGRPQADVLGPVLDVVRGWITAA
jgi:predicted alpha/beta-hydrolase family hydrolase